MFGPEDHVLLEYVPTALLCWKLWHFELLYICQQSVSRVLLTCIQEYIHGSLRLHNRARTLYYSQFKCYNRTRHLELNTGPACMKVYLSARPRNSRRP